MLRTMLKSKIHCATVTAARIEYEGSITIDQDLLEAAGIFPYEQVHVLDLDNGARLTTYALPGGSGEVCINGAAARLVRTGDRAIILAYASLQPGELEEFEPLVIRVDENNNPVSAAKIQPALNQAQGRLRQ